MLKLTYTETGFYLERLAQSLEDWVAQRVVLALRVGTSFCVEPSTASFLLPDDMPELPDLESVVQREYVEGISLSICDAEYVEVSLKGSWLSADPDDEEGIFVTALGDRTEFFLFKLWHEAQRKSASAVRE
ncbi:MAG TPA: alr0857 family protein [Candidatus Obscuribacterales bacterium]